MESAVPTLIHPYKVTRILFTSSKTTVAEVTHVNTSERFAAKYVARSRLQDMGELEALEAELRIHKSINHENIVKMVDIVYLPDYIVLIQELCDCDLFEYVTRRHYNLPLDQITSIFKQILNGLNYLHSKKIAHRDIKAENILMAIDGTPKICDFGSAECKTVKSHNVFVGSLEYIPPEMFQQPPEDTQKCDIWALGILLYFISTRNFPWMGRDDIDIVKEIVTMGVTWRDAMPRSIAKTIKMCCKPNPEDRPTVAELLAKAPLFEVSEPKARFHSLPTMIRHCQEKLIISPKTKKFNATTWV